MQKYAQAAHDVVDAMLRIPTKEARFPKRWWPGGACEHAAIAIAGVLEDRGLLDGWMIVSGKRHGEVSGHSWLVLRDAGTTIYSIDVTIHQFPEWASPFVGTGTSPAAEVFTANRYECDPFTWPYTGGENDVFLTSLRQVREILAAR